MRGCLNACACALFHDQRFLNSCFTFHALGLTLQTCPLHSELIPLSTILRLGRHTWIGLARPSMHTWVGQTVYAHMGWPDRLCTHGLAGPSMHTWVGLAGPSMHTRVGLAGPSMHTWVDRTVHAHMDWVGRTVYAHMGWVGQTVYAHMGWPDRLCTQFMTV